MNDSARQRQIDEIKKTKEQLNTATGFRKRDLRRHLCRLQKELTVYDKYHRG